VPAADRRRHRRTVRTPLGTKLKAEQLRIPVGRFWWLIVCASLALDLLLPTG